MTSLNRFIFAAVSVVVLQLMSGPASAASPDGTGAVAALTVGSFTYVMNQMEPGILPRPKALRLVDAIYA